MVQRRPRWHFPELRVWGQMHTGALDLYFPHELNRGGPHTACRSLSEMRTVVHGLLCRMCGREAPAGQRMDPRAGG